MMAEIKSVELTKTKAGARALKIVLHTADNEWIRDFIGEAAPTRISEKYWALLDITKGWSGFASEEAYDLIGLKVDITTAFENGFVNVTGISATKMRTVELPDDDIPI